MTVVDARDAELLEDDVKSVAVLIEVLELDSPPKAQALSIRAGFLVITKAFLVPSGLLSPSSLPVKLIGSVQNEHTLVPGPAISPY